MSCQVYLIGDSVIKIYVEGGLESSVHSLATEVTHAITTIVLFLLVIVFDPHLRSFVPCPCSLSSIV